MPSYSCETKVEHYRVQRNDISWVTIDSEEYFENLVKLVEVCSFCRSIIGDLISLPCHCTWC